MKCPNCGAEVTGRFCSYCGSEMPEKQSNMTVNGNIVINNYYGKDEDNDCEEEYEDEVVLAESKISKAVFVLSIIYLISGLFKSVILVIALFFIVLLSIFCLFEKGKSHKFLLRSFWPIAIGSIIFIMRL